MRLRNILFHLIMIVFAVTQLSAQNTNPVVNNVAFSISGTTVTVTYNVTDAVQSTVTINMFVSSDAGATWNYNYGAAGGNIGAGITTGPGKTITWEYSGGYAENFKIKIIANDETADGDACGKVYDASGPNNDNDGNGAYYNTIQIGDQCWLKENLDVGVMINSTTGGTSSDGEQTDNSIIEKYCYGNNTANCDTYGGLYQWNEAMQYSTTSGTQGICPTGWHLPTLAELQILRDAVGGSGNALKSVGVGTVGGEGTNTSGFNALLAGWRRSAIYFGYLDTATWFWSSTEYGGNSAYYLELYGGNDNVNNSYYYQYVGFSVRCVKG